MKAFLYVFILHEKFHDSEILCSIIFLKLTIIETASFNCLKQKILDYFVINLKGISMRYMKSHKAIQRG